VAVEQRAIERLGRSLSVVGLGTWQLGADWGAVDGRAAESVLETALAGVRDIYDRLIRPHVHERW
jgi:aryl-alcohol dehydrogenase-like predicted oxidoreductase